jgi:hypothetical protein
MDLCYMGYPNRNYNTKQCNTIHYNTDLHVTQKITKINLDILEDL